MNPFVKDEMRNKVPEVTIYFWIIKVLCTTVGETAADYLNETLGFGLAKTSLVMSTLLVAVLFFEFRAKRYVPSLYWLAVVLLSIVGTLITDNLTDHLKVPLEVTTSVFSAVLVLTFAVWFGIERTLSVHSIYTRRREGFYWSAILFTFALGTAAGDLIAEKLRVGYTTAFIIFAGCIAVVGIGHYAARAILGAQHRHQSTNAVLAFWLAYILTRPLGASVGDLLSQDRKDGGLGLGTTDTSVVFLVLILALVVYLSLTRRDETPVAVVEEEVAVQSRRSQKLRGDA